MDTALELRISTDRGIFISQSKALQMLEQSELVKKITSDLVDNPLFYVWRIIALSEIPYAQHLEYTHKLIDRIFQRLSTSFGFSLSGDEKDFLPCYNAMLISAMCRLGQAKTETVLNGVEWINKFQPMERGVTVSIPKLRFDRFGGCFKNTPCYIGVAKSVFALFAYQQETGNTNLSKKIELGIEYLLQHHLFQKLNEDEPITRHIMDISYPESYHLNIVELIRFSGNANLFGDPRTLLAVQYLQNKKRNNGWKVDFRYKSDGYTSFDDGRKNGDWVTHIIRHAMKDLCR